MLTRDPVIINYEFSDLSIKIERLEKLMGYVDEIPPEAIRSAIREILSRAAEYTDIRVGYVVLDSFERLDKGRFRIQGLEFHPGNTITGCLGSSEQLAFFMVTAGSGIETWSREMIGNGDPLAAYIIDMLGSEVVESATDMMQHELSDSMGKRGKNISNPYSPGYCGWYVDEQQKLFSLFPENFCGITLSESSLMIPIKSLSGVIGIGSEIRKMPYGCQICNAKDCYYRDSKEVLKEN